MARDRQQLQTELCDEWVGGLFLKIIEWLIEWLIDWMIEWMIERMNEWTNERTNEWMNDWMIKRTVVGIIHHITTQDGGAFHHLIKCQLLILSLARDRIKTNLQHLLQIYTILITYKQAYFHCPSLYKWQFLPKARPPPSIAYHKKPLYLSNGNGLQINTNNHNIIKYALWWWKIIFRDRRLQWNNKQYNVVRDKDRREGWRWARRQSLLVGFW